MADKDTDRNIRNAIQIGPFHLGSGGPNQVLASAESFAIPKDSKIEVFGYVYDNAGGINAAPTDAPAGTFAIYAAPSDNQPYTRVTAADVSDGTLQFSLTGNNQLINAVANFEDFPGVRGKIIFTRTATGSAGANARAVFYIARRGD